MILVGRINKGVRGTGVQNWNLRKETETRSWTQTRAGCTVQNWNLRKETETELLIFFGTLI